MRLLVSALLVGFVAVGLIAFGSSQIVNPTTAGILTGIVVDGNGAGVAGATVDLRVGARVDRTTVTDASGQFRFESVPAGSYDIRAFKTGFQPVSMMVVVVHDRPIPAVRLALARPSPAAASPREEKRERVVDEAVGGLPNVPPPPPSAPVRIGGALSGGVGGGVAYGQMMARQGGDFNTEAYDKIDENRFHRVTDDPLSTFSIDVDTASYSDSLHEARRVLIAEAGSTLITVAKDVKIQVEFNPRAVGAYKLIGYENRILQHQDFNNDKKDAGEIGAGHTVTALYEIIPAGEPIEGAGVDPLKYQEGSKPHAAAKSDELMTVKLRYKQPDGDTSQLISVAVRNSAGELTPNLGFASAVAEFGMLLRRSEFKGQATWSTAQELARRHRGDDPDGYRAEFVRLVELASALDAQNMTSPQSRR